MIDGMSLQQSIEETRKEADDQRVSREDRHRMVWAALRNAYIMTRALAPGDRSPADRLYSITSTDLEHVWSNFTAWANSEGPQMP